MAENISIQKATVSVASEVAVMVGELLDEIITSVGIQAFNFNLDDTVTNLKNFMDQEKYFVFVAYSESSGPVGFITLYESYALYAEGAFGTISELFVRPKFRSQNVGLWLLEQARNFGNSRGWKRLEVTTPPLPQFDKTLAFYEREGFTISGGRKLKAGL